MNSHFLDISAYFTRATFKPDAESATLTLDFFRRKWEAPTSPTDMLSLSSPAALDTSWVLRSDESGTEVSEDWTWICSEPAFGKTCRGQKHCYTLKVQDKLILQLEITTALDLHLPFSIVTIWKAIAPDFGDWRKSKTSHETKKADILATQVL